MKVFFAVVGISVVFLMVVIMTARSIRSYVKEAKHE